MSKIYLDVYELHFFLYNLTGYGHLELKRKWQYFLYSVYHIVLKAYLVFNNVLCIYLLYGADNDVKEEMYIITMLLTTLCCSLKIFAMDVHRSKVEKLHRKLNKQLSIPKIGGYSWTREIEKNMERRFALITKVFYASVSVALATFIVPPVFYPGVRSLPYVFPCKNLPSPYYETVYVIHGIVIILFMVNTVSYDMICCGFLLRLSSHMEMVATNLDMFAECYPCLNYSELIPGYSDFLKRKLLYNNTCGSFSDLMRCNNYMVKTVYDKKLTKKTISFLKENIAHHQEIIRQLDKINMIFSVALVLQLLAGTIVFCICASVMFSDNINWLKDIRLGMYAVGGFVDLFLYCYCGTFVISSGEIVQRSLYSLPWYEMHPKARKLIMFALMRLHSSKGITAAKVISVNFDLFLKIMKFAHSLIALLKEI